MSQFHYFTFSRLHSDVYYNKLLSVTVGNIKKAKKNKKPYYMICSWKILYTLLQQYYRLIITHLQTLNWQTKLQKTWNEVRVEDPNKSMLEWLSTFYDVILSTWHTEVHVNKTSNESLYSRAWLFICYPVDSYTVRVMSSKIQDSPRHRVPCLKSNNET